MNLSTTDARLGRRPFHQMTRLAYALPLTLLPILLAACAEAPGEAGISSTLDPRGPAAAAINELWWVMFALGTAVFVLVVVLLIITVRLGRRRRTPYASVLSPGNHLWIWLGGIALPAIVTLIILYYNLRISPAYTWLDPSPAAVIEVTGHLWWWEVVYPDAGVVTANEIHIPVGQPVEIHLTSADVIHSFWVPQLQGKMDLFPGESRRITIQADEPGVYRGVCAEFCGLQHANMAFLVIAEPAEAFTGWLEAQSQPAVEPQNETLQAGQDVFFSAGCATCHAIRGTRATADIGPDLTHIASRRTLAAGALSNNRGSLAGWIVDPQHVKPGNLMPPTSPSAEELILLLDYLSSLE